MINIKFHKDGIVAEGHSEYDAHGRDIVCAGVSAIILGALNCFNEKDIKLEMDSGGYLNLKIKKWNDTYKIVFKTIKAQLMAIQESYSEYVKIEGGN